MLAKTTLASVAGCAKRNDDRHQRARSTSPKAKNSTKRTVPRKYKQKISKHLKKLHMSTGDLSRGKKTIPANQQSSLINVYIIRISLNPQQRDPQLETQKPVVVGYRLNRLDEPVFIAIPKPLLIEFGIHNRYMSHFTTLIIERVANHILSRGVAQKTSF